MEKNWARYLNGALTVCDKEGIIIYLNPESISNFKKDGGADLLAPICWIAILNLLKAG